VSQFSDIGDVGASDVQNFSNVNEDDVNQGISMEVVEKGEKVSKRELCLRG